MTRRAIVAAAAFSIAAALVAVAVVTLRGRPSRESVPRAAPLPAGARGVVDAGALARLHGIPFYRALGEATGLRSCTKDADGAVHVDIDLRALAGPRLASLGWSGAGGLLPAEAQGTILIANSPGAADRSVLSESWLIPGPAPLLDILDRTPAGAASSIAGDAVPGTPAAVVRMRIVPSRLSDPRFGGAVLSSWRDRADFAESLFGRPWRAELAEDLAGPAVLALYETADGSEADGVLALELRRSDRAAALLETLFGLGALTERAMINRYRGVATGSFDPGSDGPGLAAAVDGLVLLVATSRSRLESAIDARRGESGRGRFAVPAGDLSTSWSAESASAFAAHGWWRLARCAGDPAPVREPMTATLRPEGRSGWVLAGRGPAPAITADPLVPLLRSAFTRRQREGG